MGSGLFWLQTMILLRYTHPWIYENFPRDIQENKPKEISFQNETSMFTLS
jgi:hypothetical protein